MYGHLLSIIDTQSFLKLTEQPKSGFIKKGQFYVLTCNANGSGILMYSWEHKILRKWTPVGRYGAEYCTSSPGRYRCRVKNEAGSIVSEVAFIKYYSECMYSLNYNV